MECYRLRRSSGFDRQELFDQHESLIWTDRWNAYGDFEVTAPSSDNFDSVFAMDNWIGHSHSDRIMRVFEREDYMEEDGRRMSRASGRSFESLLERTAMYPRYSTSEKYITWNGSTEDIVHRVVKDFFGGYPNFHVRSASVADTQDWVTLELETVYESIQKLLDTEGKGFSITYNENLLDNSTDYLEFRILTSRDRSDSIIFSEEQGTLANEKHLQSKYDWRNTAVVQTKGRQYRTTAYTGSGPIPSDQRYTIFVDAGDLKVGTEQGDFKDVSQLMLHLMLLGEQALAEHQAINAVDGEIGDQQEYKYGEDYILGDIVTIRTAKGVTRKAKITEQIWSDDLDGSRIYPTFETIDD